MLSRRSFFSLAAGTAVAPLAIVTGAAAAQAPKASGAVTLSRVVVEVDQSQAKALLRDIDKKIAAIQQNEWRGGL